MIRNLGNFPYIFGMYEDYKTFKMVRVFGRKPGQLVAITSAYDAAVFLLQEWPEETGDKYRLAKEIMLKCLEGGCSAAVARVAFVEAARGANIYMEAEPLRTAYTGKPDPKWGKRKTARKA
ncbi:MAG: DUF982 domain-containing protein [Phyllobacterium sp.]|uniref:DUF982 domain-containing protein n=1 Tax=Phyllobacterium sp. TaxID=1871046 RepID=UPI0030F2ECB5